MKLALLILLACIACAACSVRERVIYRTAPPQIIEKHYLMPVMPIQMEKAEPENKPEMAT